MIPWLMVHRHINSQFFSLRVGGILHVDCVDHVSSLHHQHCHSVSLPQHNMSSTAHSLCPCPCPPLCPFPPIVLLPPTAQIIMLLSLSLTLLLIPWVSHHPEFLIAPVLLACTPVVGNGVRPVLKELAAGAVTVMKLFGMAAWFDITHELPPHQHSHPHHLNGHHNHQASHHSSSSVSNGGAHMAPNQRGSMQQQQQQYGREGLYQQQQQRPSGPYSPWPQQPQPRPSGPHSPWPNPAYTTLAQQQQQAAAGAVTNPGGVMSHPISNDADVDWAPSSPPDPHRCVRGSAELWAGAWGRIDHQKGVQPENRGCMLMGWHAYMLQISHRTSLGVGLLHV